MAELKLILRVLGLPVLEHAATVMLGKTFILLSI